jgi:DNA-binding transcriptional LysR family regulator
MDLRQLEYFVAVAEAANFTRAAERVHVSQSGISAQIRQLERELGAVLFDRSKRGATLTVAGSAALEHARSTLASAGAVAQAVGEVTDLIRGRLAVGMVVGCTVVPLFEALASFRRAHPGVTISLLEDNSDRLIDGVRSAALDLALIGVAGELPAGLNGRTIIRERLVAVVPPDHPLAHRRPVDLADIVAYPIICMPTGTGLRTAFDEGCAALGLRPAIAMQAGAADAIAALAARGLGVGLLSESMAARTDAGLRAVAITDLSVPVLLALVWGESISPALREALAHAEAAFA